MRNRLYNFIVKQAGATEQLAELAGKAHTSLSDVAKAPILMNYLMLNPSNLAMLVKDAPKGEKLSTALYPFVTLPGNALNASLMGAVDVVSKYPKTSAAVAALGGGSYLGAKHYNSKNKPITESVKDTVEDMNIGELLNDNKFAIGGGVGGAGLGALLGGESTSGKLLGALLGGGAGAGLGYLADKNL